MKQFPSVNERATYLVNTSVQDMTSGLYNYDGTDASDVETIRKALQICLKRGEKTKVTILRRKLKRMEKERIRAIYLSRLEERGKADSDASV